jgi:hypothetical protein
MRKIYDCRDIHQKGFENDMQEAIAVTLPSGR